MSQSNLLLLLLQYYIKETAPDDTNEETGLYLIMCWSPFCKSIISSL
jgi:hypothetical protein